MMSQWLLLLCWRIFEDGTHLKAAVSSVQLFEPVPLMAEKKKYIYIYMCVCCDIKHTLAGLPCPVAGREGSKIKFKQSLAAA